MQPGTPTFRFSVLKWTAFGAGLFVLLLAAAAAYLRWFSPLDRAWVIKALSDHYECNVELRNFRSSLFPAVTMYGEGLELRRKDSPGLPPMASVARFSVNATWFGLLRHPRHFEFIELDGLALNVPPRKTGSQSVPASQKKKSKAKPAPFVLDTVTADGATLNILSSKPDKAPAVFEIHKLGLQSAGVGQPMRFQAVLTNPRPAGEIQSNGTFGPWNSDDPSLTPVSGKYSFQHADLSTIRGLAGILSSEGSYDGVLSDINVHGETDTPDFALGVTGNPVHLRTRFEAVVDGVSGDTFLRPVTAELLSSTIVAQGGEARTADVNGRTILLDVTARPARLEDLLRLAVKSPTPPMIGGVRIQAKLDLPPGQEDIARRLKLDADFSIDGARFTAAAVEAKMKTLSRIGQGLHGQDVTVSAPLSMTGHFVLAGGLAKFSRLTFQVPGAMVQLQGTFGLESQAVDFEGTLSLQATVSQMTTGVKSKLLKLVDPLFERNGAGTVLPIRISGTRQEPSFELEIGKALRRGN